MPETIDLDELRSHIGRSVSATDIATAVPANLHTLTFDRDEPEFKEGDVLPPGWHGLYFLPRFGPDGLRKDGTPRDTGVAPPSPLPRRMYAGQSLRFHGPIRIGDSLRRDTELTDITLKSGSAGNMIFTTVTSRIYAADELAVEEEGRFVALEAIKPGAKNIPPRREAAPDDSKWRRTITPNPIDLFRYSALTFNSHLIHYDRGYATGTEGYPGLVVHGPFTSTLLINFARDNHPGRRMVSYDMRAKAPLFDIAPFEIAGNPTDGGTGCDLWAATPGGTVAMSAHVEFEN
ncbi:MAG: MaoC family dehydratase N-terminal domain-containing protein [Rhodospirillales bacterium]|nr:MaoC family dehydratase N-terminal domain-containing protein [Rhodospirillales bacterium]